MSNLNPKLLREETVESSIAALRLELKYTLGDVPTGEQWTSWISGFHGDQTRLLEIIERRNPWAANFSHQIHDFWVVLGQRLAAFK